VPTAVAAFAGSVIPILGVILPGLFVEGTVRNSRELLLTVDEQPWPFLAGRILHAVGTALLAVVFLYLYRAARARRPQTPDVVRVLAIAGPLGVAVTLLATHVTLAGVADEFARSGRTPAEAEALLREARPAVLSTLGFVASFTLGAATILVSVNAMRAGLLSRFLGVLGVAVGALGALQLSTGPPIIQSFWLGAVGLLLLDRWPGGRGPAWDTGHATPWPSAAELRARTRGTGPEETEPGLATQASGGPGDPRGNSAGTPGDDSGERPMRRKRKRRVR
jgi:hypothetical protein